MRLFGLIGRPLTHSFSKKYFSEKFERENLADCRYELFPLEDIAELPHHLQSYPMLEGLNVTIPYKKQVLPFLTTSHLPAGLDACNCIRIKNGNLEGYNTDIAGFEKSLTPLLQPHHRMALVLGSGGASVAVRFVLEKLGIDYKVVSRNGRQVNMIAYHEIDQDLLEAATLIINTTPLGTYPDIGFCAEIPYQFLGEKHLLYDLVYNPAKTLFLQKGEERGAQIKNGEEMLVLQAEESWRIWNE